MSQTHKWWVFNFFNIHNREYLNEVNINLIQQ